jgi:hypothetical protein
MVPGKAMRYIFIIPQIVSCLNFEQNLSATLGCIINLIELLPE